MPQETGKQKRQWLGSPTAPAKISAGPSQGLMRRIFGGPMSESLQTEWPELAKEWATQEMRMPFETSQTPRVRPMNWFEKFALPKAQAVTLPWGTIGLNRDMIEQGSGNLGDILVHELTHVGQPTDLGLEFRRMIGAVPAYLDRPEEKEAWAAEAKRYRPRDINLPIDTGPKKRK